MGPRSPSGGGWRRIGEVRLCRDVELECQPASQSTRLIEAGLRVALELKNWSVNIGLIPEVLPGSLAT